MRVLPILLTLGIVSADSALSQTSGAAMLVPKVEYHESDLPPSSVDTWLVMHRKGGEVLLEPMEVVITAYSTCGDEEGEQGGRSVTVPAAPDPLLLVRGHPSLRAGSVRTVFPQNGESEHAHRVEVLWDGQPVVVRHISDEPTDEELGSYRIELLVGNREFVLHREEWHGDGDWRVRWIGDLNRDGWPDLLVDASFKYSVFTTRLYLSSLAGDGELELSEWATTTRVAC